MNKFLLRLDIVPEFWEDRVVAFAAYMIEIKKIQSSTLKSYISPIKHMLKVDGYEWQDNRVYFHSLIRSCRLSNDVVKTRLPIQFGMFELLLFEIERKLGTTQPYLETMYKTLFSLAYYGLMGVGELAWGDHSIKAKNIHIAANKNKILILLYSSKTHDKESKPQEIKISSNECTGSKHKFFCLFTLVRNFLQIRGDYASDGEQFFIMADKSPVTPAQVRNMLRMLITALNLNPRVYDCHSFRIGQGTNLLKFGFDVETIKKLGRWKSNAVYKYMRQY